jgi:hypothetical protein
VISRSGVGHAVAVAMRGMNELRDSEPMD